jgi:hypothetical protein
MSARSGFWKLIAGSILSEESILQIFAVLIGQTETHGPSLPIGDGGKR